MIPPVTDRTAIVGGVKASAAFGLSLANESHLMGILREGLYSDKVLAVLREYSANAWDAHRSIGKHAVPIRVTVPSWDSPLLLIRDFGPGLSHEDMFKIYTQYGASTKRDSNDVVGMLGIGSKSGFAYSDSFTITSRHGGMCRIYVASLGEDEKGALNLLSELPCEADDTGIEIQIATKQSDRSEFQRTAVRLFQHMTPRPEINIELPAVPDEQTVLTNGTITPGEDEWIAIMGCVPYRINLAALDPELLNGCLSQLGGLLNFKLGEVQVSASREELKYTAATKAALIAKFDALVDEYVAQALAQLDAGQLSGWESRLRVKVLQQLKLPLPEKWKLYGETYAKITYSPDDFTLILNGSAITRVTVDANTVLLIDDTGRELSGYHTLNQWCYVVRSTTKTPAELQTLLDAALKGAGLDGVTVVMLSTKPWTAPPPPPAKKIKNPKHRAQMFQLADEHTGARPWSDNWTAVTRVPTADDVFIVLEHFEGVNYDDFWTDCAQDGKIAAMFGETLPAVYGYKTTKRKPVTNSDCTGTHYREWRKTWVQGLLTPERAELIANYWLAQLSEERSYRDERDTPDATGLTWLKNQLGDDHPLVALFIESKAAGKKVGNKYGALSTFAARVGLTYNTSTTAARMKTLRSRYKLLSRSGIRSLWDPGYGAEGREVRDEWLDYVKMRDALDAPAPANLVQLVSVP